MRRILVTGAGGSAGMNFIQSLRMSKNDYYIVGTDSSKYFAKLSQADKTYVVPPLGHKYYLPALLSIIDRCELEFLHAQPDPEVAYLAEHRKELGCKTFFPETRTIDIAQDKYEFAELMQQHDVPVPNTELVGYPQKLKKLLKGDKMWLRASKGAGSLAALPVSDYNQAYYWIEYWKTKGLDWGDFILSDLLTGKEFAWQSLWKDGELITSAGRERIEYLFGARMPSGQSSSPTVAKSVHNDDVNTVGRIAVKALDPKASGIFCVDMKCNSSGMPCVTEINCGRFFTTSLFFTTAGANMPDQFISLGLGEKVDAPKYNAVPENLYWIRNIDCSQVIVKEEDIEKDKGDR
jgi:carbamoyl-phosphate synthase large subunit